MKSMHPSDSGNRPLNSDEQKAVLDSAVFLCSQRGLPAAFSERLAEASGISPARIEAHFGSPSEILRSVLERELELIAGSVTVPELRFPGETILDELEVLARIIVDEYRSRIDLLRGLILESVHNRDFARLFYRSFILRGRRLFTEFLEARRSRGELRDDLDVEAAAAFFLSALTFSVLLLELFGGKDVEQVTDDRLVHSMSDLFLKGALARENE